MSSLNRELPPSLRYLKARFQPFGKPMFWGSAIVLSLLAVIIWQYWEHPEWFKATLDEPEVAGSNLQADPEDLVSDSDLSLDELAAGAEIDNLDLLLQQFEQGRTVQPASPSGTQEQQADSANTSTQPATSEIPQQNSEVNNPVANSTSELLNSRSAFVSGSYLNDNSNRQNRSSSPNTAAQESSGLQFPSLLGSTNRNQEAASESALQQSLNRLRPINSRPTTAETAETQTSTDSNSQSQSSPTSTSPGQVTYSSPSQQGINSSTPFSTTPTSPPNTNTNLGQFQSENSAPPSTPNNFGQGTPQSLNQTPNNSEQVSPGSYQTGWVTPGSNPNLGN